MMAEAKTMSSGFADQIIIDGLMVRCVIGCLDWERRVEQSLQLNLRLQLDLQQAGQTDQLDHTISYAEVCEVVSRTLQQQRSRLLEHAAYQVMLALFDQFELLQSVRVHLIKPGIIPAAQAVGICMERSRHDLCTGAGQ